MTGSCNQGNEQTYLLKYEKFLDKVWNG